MRKLVKSKQEYSIFPFSYNEKVASLFKNLYEYAIADLESVKDMLLMQGL